MEDGVRSLDVPYCEVAPPKTNQADALKVSESEPGWDWRAKGGSTDSDGLGSGDHSAG